MKLTATNYYNPKRNKYLSNSKINDYNKDPYYFYERHIKCCIEFKSTPAMIVGSAVDTILTGSWEDFNEQYVVATPKEALPAGVTRITSAQYDTIQGIALAVERTDAFKDLKKYKTQKILQVDFPDMGIWKGVSGIPDFLHIDAKKHQCEIIDLKTSSTVAHRKFHFHALDFNYYRQAAMYKMMVQLLYPKVKKFINKLLVVENTGLHRVNVFDIDQEYLDNIIPYIYNDIQVIVKHDDYNPTNIKWDDALALPFKQQQEEI